MRCQSCDNELTVEDRFCNHCGTQNTQFERSINENTENVQKERTAYSQAVIESDKRAGLVLGIVSTSLVIVSFVIFGFLSFVTLGLSIYGLVLTNRNGKSGKKDTTAFTLNIIAISLSAIGAILMVLYWTTL